MTASSVLGLLLAAFLALLYGARGWLGRQAAPGLSVYVLVLAGLTVALWLITWAYVSRLRALEAAAGEEDDAP